MALNVSCHLCSFPCNEYKLLYDANGGVSEVYELTIKYFHSWLLDDVETESMLKVICVECWQHISDFHKFQQWILNTRTQEDLKFIIKEEDLSEQTTTVFNRNEFEIHTPLTNTIESNESISMSSSDCNGYEVCALDENMLECYHCKELFQNHMALDAHLKLCHNNMNNDEQLNAKLNLCANENFKPNNEKDKNVVKCEICEASFSQYGNLRRHVRKQHAVQPLLKWICKYCNKLFKKKSLLDRHKNNLHKKQPNDNSQQIVDNKENNVKGSNVKKDKKYQELLSPEEIHTTATAASSKLSTKDDTEEEFMDADLVENLPGAEINGETQIQRPTLEIIDVKYEVFSDDDDERKVDNDMPVQNSSLSCPKCSHLVNSYIQLKEHFEFKHPDERCYINCCHITLYEPFSILEHLEFHKNPYAFKCTECGKCFKGRKGLSSHKLQVHSNNRSKYHLHLCCCKMGVELHEAKLVKGQQMEYDTRVCCQRKKKILEDDKLIAKWRKELTCEICKANFPYYSLMRSHSYYEHPGEKCYILCCQRKMSRTSDTLEHIRFHLNPHLYRCPECKIDFSAKNTLAKHMRNVHRDKLPKHKWACDECDKTYKIRQILTRHKNVCHSKKSVDNF